jgi:cell division protein FtsN
MKRVKPLLIIAALVAFVFGYYFARHERETMRPTVARTAPAPARPLPSSSPAPPARKPRGFQMKEEPEQEDEIDKAERIYADGGDANELLEEGGDESEAIEP